VKIDSSVIVTKCDVGVRKGEVGLCFEASFWVGRTRTGMSVLLIGMQLIKPKHTQPDDAGIWKHLIDDPAGN